MNHAGSRNYSLDALRGTSILLMVLSGSIAFGGLLPGWMYHAQVPPPGHKFNPAIPGITWVDLVFPFFLFSMGAALPLALQKWQARPNGTYRVWWIAVRRYLQLTWFALFIYHMRAWVIHPSPSAGHYLLSLLAFVLLFMQLYQWPQAPKKHWPIAVKLAGYGISAVLLVLLPFNNGAGFSLQKSDIIILVLGNMAFFGTLAYWHTRHSAMVRLGVLPFVMAVFMAGSIPHSWTAAVYNWTPADWMYKFYFLKYLFIVIPGTIAGEWMLKQKASSPNQVCNLLPGVVGLLLVVTNVTLLYSRMLVLNVVVSLVLIAVMGVLVKPAGMAHLKPLWQWGGFWLMLGLVAEACEGGIKKDPSTYSYYFVTAGLAYFVLLSFHQLQQVAIGKKVLGYLAGNGQNPMVAYVAGSLLVTPVLYLIQVQPLLNSLQQNAWMGFLKGVIFTALVSIITYLFTQRKWFWKS
ncbi:MAG: DUF5009 domain-containing protein [Chitinophagaceae bacterium]|jgi:predicted acyltransferase|nr:DUF5009 domain-containing protein [Chitinophagaceae bacterium]